MSESPSDGSFGLIDFLLLLMAVIWGVNYSAVKYASGYLTPTGFTWLRVVLAAITLWIVALVQRKPWPSMRDMLMLAALGVIGNGLYQLLFVNGVSRTRIADAALIVASAPACIAIISRLRGSDHVTPRMWGGIFLSIVGVGIVILGSSRVPQRTGSVIGAACMVGAVICWSSFTVLLRRFTIRVDSVQLNALTMTGGVLPLLFVTPALMQVPWHTAPTWAWLCLFYSSAISMGVAYLFWYRGVRLIGPTRTSVYGNLQPVVAILVAWITLHEMPTLWQAAGAATIISGILLTRT